MQSYELSGSALPFPNTICGYDRINIAQHMKVLKLRYQIILSDAQLRDAAV